MAAKNPFLGIRLSEQAAPGQLEQRLFTTESKPDRASPPTQSSPKASAAPKAEPSRPTKEAGSSAALTRARQLKPASLTAARFDLANLPLYKASYVFTQEELEALDDLKLELRRELDSKVTKNDLIRAALHMLIEDYAANGERSYACRKARKK